MRDADYALFIECNGEATHRIQVPESSFIKWEEILPPILMTYWREEGWAGYGNGRLWTVNPDDYEHIKDVWLEGTPFENFDNFHVIARSAFGNLYLCGEKTGRSVTLTCIHNEIQALKNRLKTKALEKQDITIQSLFGPSEPEDFDYHDINRKLLFDRAVKKYGPLASDEMYGFEPALVLGGSPSIKNLRRVKIDPHLLILRELDTPTFPFAGVDLGKL